MTDLLSDLNQHAPEAHRNPKWPRTSSHLSGELKQLSNALRQIGVTIEQAEHINHSQRRTVRLFLSSPAP
jgi:hypothetical protein